jgi:hypothetical protein
MPTSKSKYINYLIAKLVSIFADVDEKREEREELSSHESNKPGTEA